MTNKLLLILLVFVFGTANADDYSVRDYKFTKQQKIIAYKVMRGGQINEEIHQKFWDDMPKEELLSILKNSSNFDSQVNELFLVGEKLNMAMWQSVLLSYNDNKVTKTASYINIAKKYKDDKAYEKILYNAERIIKSAATRTPLRTDRGTLNVTPEVANYMLSTLEETFQKVKILFDPNYYE